jgi:NurA-like 5'-3' nuclease
MEKKDFEDLGWRIARYFGESGFRFGHYAIVRFDSLPGSKDLFAVDVPDHLFFRNREQVLLLLSGLIQQVSATAYPVPGYPIALRQAHNKVVLTQDRAKMLENSLRRSLPPDAYEFLNMLA